ncbi:MAG TPA: TIGR01777 family oxidoreductase [Enhygromyxa sp.]|nr:TIGR01777 family oxidoreductase [Enhygromyxa sp.]
MRVAITGATGLIGSALAEALRERGDEPIVISRHPEPATTAIGWDPVRGFDPPDVLSGCDAVVNLAGESIAGRWTTSKKLKIRDSRLHATKSVVDAIAAAHPRPRVLISASGIGIHGDRGDELLDESSEPGDDFLAEVCRGWEAAAREVEALDGPAVRLCIARFGMVLDRHGGALPQLLTPFRLGLGGPIGDGRQWMSWVHRRDAVDALLLMLDRQDARGPYHVVAPNPVRNREFGDTLAAVLERPAFMRVPKLGVRLLLGEMGRSLLLAGQRAVPKRLLDAGFVFGFPELRAALENLLG